MIRAHSHKVPTCAFVLRRLTQGNIIDLDPTSRFRLLTSAGLADVVTTLSSFNIV